MASALVVGGMIGSGIFLLPSALARFGWVSLWGWVAAIAGAMLLAWLIGKLTRAMPDSEGAVMMCRQALGPLPGVMIGWSYWAANCCTNAVYAIGAVAYLATLIPAIGGSTTAVVLSANAILWSLTVLNMRGGGAVGRVQMLTTILKLVPLITVLAVLAWLAVSHPPVRLQPMARMAMTPVSLTSALGTTFFAMLGFEGVSVVASLVRSPERNVPRAMMLGTGLTGMLFLVICTGIILTVPAALLSASGAPAALFLETYLGHGIGPIVAIFVSISIIGALNGWLLINAELPLGMARDGLLPRLFTRLSKRGVPVRLLLLSSGTSCAMILVGHGQTSSGLLAFMLLVTTASNLWLYVGVCIALIVLRVARFWAIIALAFSLWVIWGTGWEAARDSVLLALTGLPLYALSRLTK